MIGADHASRGRTRSEQGGHCTGAALLRMVFGPDSAFQVTASKGALG